LANYLIERLKKTRLRRPVGSDFTYSEFNGPINELKNVDTVTSTSFNNQQFASNLPGQNVGAPESVGDYLLLENEDVMIAENNDNIII
jgi:hypothetical protein